MKALIFGDPHIGVKNDGFDRNPEIINAFDYILNYAIENEIDDLFCLGDFWDNNRPDASSWSCAIEILKKVHLSGKKLHTITGNHDEIHNVTKMSALAALSSLPFNIEFHHEIVNMVVDKLNFIFVPYISRSKLDKPVEEYLAEKIEFYYLKGYKNYIFGHFHMDKITKKQIIPAWKLPELKVKIKKVFNGHIHDGQEIGNFLLPGSMVNNDFSEVTTPSFIVYDFDNSAYERIDIPNSRKFITRKYNTEVDGTEITIGCLDEIKDNFLRIELELNELENVVFKNEDEVKKIAAKYFGVFPKYRSKVNEVANIAFDEDPFEVFRKKLNTMNLDPNEYTELLDMGVTIMKESLN